MRPAWSRDEAGGNVDVLKGTEDVGQSTVLLVSSGGKKESERGRLALLFLLPDFIRDDSYLPSFYHSK